ncbi:hypothetical protein BDF19DRAFT_192680 [Syncephalis fuscata]|nr:hypothetical protein BDF19DRAFT_192680 [Syncephalis fuscata]
MDNTIPLGKLPATVQSDIDLFGAPVLGTDHTLAVELSTATSQLSSPSPSLSSSRLQTNKPNDSSLGTETQRLYCIICKKSFATDATWQAHLRSTKHINAAKSQHQRAAPAQKSTRKSASNNSNSSSNIIDKKETTAAITEILDKRKQAERIASTKKDMAATVYFNIAKALWQANAVRETAKTLTMLHSLLNDSTLNTNAKESANDGTISTAQTRKLIGLSMVG